VSGFGDPDARLAIIGLAPAAHGANRTGRMFTGDRSGDWLYAALHRAGYANQPESIRAMTDFVCAMLTSRQWSGVRRRQTDRPQRSATIASLPDPRARAARALQDDRRPRRICIGRWRLLGCYHPSQQNTFTGRLTAPMLDQIFARARQLSG
jgi:uracil-DNA glycosylase